MRCAVNFKDFRLHSFSRRIGKALRPFQKQLVAELLPQVAITLPTEGLLDIATLFPTPKTALWMEIGFGSGEHLAMQAAQHPTTGIIGCEPYINGVVQLLKHIHAEKPGNIRLWADDAIEVLERLPDQLLERVFILFPDPWPKLRHHKRRIISGTMLDLLARKLQHGGELRLATDHVEYAEWMKEHLSRHKEFDALTEDTATPPSGWIKTRYQEKAEAEGRPPIFFRYARRPVRDT
jgi:tRNA (guanine-N7-)-methyltransferase